MKIGVIHPDDLKDLVFDHSDPYSHDPSRHPALVFHSEKPCIAEPHETILIDSWITPTDLWFVRHHHPVPNNFSVDSFRLSVDENKRNSSVQLSVDDIKNIFPKKSIVATIQCAGNRRSEMDKEKKTIGIPWKFGAISTAQFGGASLIDILKYAGIESVSQAESTGIKHIQFESLDGVLVSIPIEKALNPFGDVIIAYEMNDKPLVPDHGYPLRVIVPGHVGVRSLKWINKIIPSSEEAEGTWQRGMAYKMFAPYITNVDGINVEKMLSVQEQPVSSVIVSPQNESIIEPSQEIEVKGYAFSGGGRGIARVDVSSDGGHTWYPATLTAGKDQPPYRSWAWTFWESNIPLLNKDEKEIHICCKATDASFNVQPENIAPNWNMRGINNNAWHRITLKVSQDSSK
eukprot:c20703_g1_i2.p1 GENE.c20703_g1_i2~~c20703_g1_i2.p1  ORF type:complete len:402 (+),score=136.45 c20703_g1_i2:88-1293(+)